MPGADQIGDLRVVPAAEGCRSARRAPARLDRKRRLVRQQASGSPRRARPSSPFQKRRQRRLGAARTAPVRRRWHAVRRRPGCKTGRPSASSPRAPPCASPPKRQITQLSWRCAVTRTPPSGRQNSRCDWPRRCTSASMASASARRIDRTSRRPSRSRTPPAPFDTAPVPRDDHRIRVAARKARAASVTSAGSGVIGQRYPASTATSRVTAEMRRRSARPQRLSAPAPRPRHRPTPEAVRAAQPATACHVRRPNQRRQPGVRRYASPSAAEHASWRTSGTTAAPPRSGWSWDMGGV